MVRVEGWLTNLSGPVPGARRIVSIAPSNTEILHALGLGRRIVAVDNWSDYPPRVARLPKLGSDLRVDIDRVVAIQPDIVVASLHVPGMEDNVARFREAGLAFVAVGGVGLNGIWEDLRVLGRTFGRERRAATLIAQTQQRMEELARQFSSRGRKRPRVHWEWSAHPIVAANRSWVTELIHMAGGENMYADLDQESARINVDEAIGRNPDAIVACWCGARKPPTVHRVASRAGWTDTSAVRNGRVAVFDEVLFGRPGPRLAQGLEQLGRFLHPERA